MTKQAEYGENPFKPGAGLAPPYLAGRDQVLADWRGNQLASGRFRRPEILMYGPRGTGKTAILREFQLAPPGADCHLVRASAPILEHGADAMADKLLAKFEEASYLDTETTSSVGQAGVTVPGLAEAGVATEQSRTVKHRHPADLRTIEERLRAVAQQKPLILLLDEAHAVASTRALETLGALVNAVQQLVSEDERICLVLAGTPGVRQALRDANCFFAIRFHRIGVGLLDAEAAKDAIEKPLAEHVWRQADPASRLQIEPAALDALVEDSQGYPHFLQLWGSALWDQAAARGAEALTLDDITVGKQAVDADRTAHYQERGAEINFDDDLLAAANAAAAAFQQHYAKGDIRYIKDTAIINAVEQALTPAYPDKSGRAAALKRCVEELARLGFVWEPPGSRYMEPGIPSFLNYAQELYAERRGNRQAD